MEYTIFRPLSYVIDIDRKLVLLLLLIYVLLLLLIYFLFLNFVSVQVVSRHAVKILRGNPDGLSSDSVAMADVFDCFGFFNLLLYCCFLSPLWFKHFGDELIFTDAGPYSKAKPSNP